MTEQHVRDEYPLSEITARIIKAAKEVHGELGPGFEEVIYQRALALELPVHDLDFSREVWIDVHYTYSHSRGFIALRATTGVELTELEINDFMGVNSDIPIYFGESFDNGYFLMDAGDEAVYPGTDYDGIIGHFFI